MLFGNEVGGVCIVAGVVAEVYSLQTRYDVMGWMVDGGVKDYTTGI